MESDPFATPQGGDPFAETPTPPPSAPEPTPEPPAPDPEPPAPPAAPEPTAADLEPSAPPEPGEIPTVDREGAPISAPEATQAPPAAPEAPPATEEAGSPPEPPTPPAAPPAADEPDPAAAAVATTPANGAGATPPTNSSNEPKKGHRHYVVLYQTGPGQFALRDLQELHGKPDRDFIVRVVEPPEKEGESEQVNYYLEARNNDHAYRLCFVMFDRPQSGVTVLPLPKASWRPKRVAPAPPQPERERLVIS